MRHVGLIALALPPAPAQADVLICDLTARNCTATSLCEAFQITLNTHHGADAPYLQRGGQRSAMLEIAPEGSTADTYVTLGAADREFITLFNGFDAIHTRHYTVDGTPVAQTSTGGCTSFY